VDVGVGVSVGRGVKVSVGRDVWVVVAGLVEDGSGLVVKVEVGDVDTGWGSRVNPPQPINNKVVVEIVTRIFRKSL